MSQVPGNKALELHGAEMKIKRESLDSCIRNELDPDEDHLMSTSLCIYGLWLDNRALMLYDICVFFCFVYLFVLLFLPDV